MAGTLPAFSRAMALRDMTSWWLARPWILGLTAWTPHVLPASLLHCAALHAAAARDRHTAERLFERAALAYQLDGDLEGFARLKAHRRPPLGAPTTI